jgi:type II secretory ATPase GspE/PulE/Tfp pilus assembly ATPase PilB-like protein
LEQPDFDSNRLVDLSLALAHLLGSSDVHFFFGTSELRILLRIDGALHNIPLPTRRILSEQIVQLRNTLKLRSGIDASRKGVPLEGILELDMEQGSIIASVSFVPLIDGEKAVLHLSGRLELKGFDQIGLATSERAKILPLLKRSSGLIVVSGPTGCGKTTSLYALLEKIPSISRNVLTIETHVEARLPFASQLQLNKEKGFTAQAALISALDQDPDVIMIGELNDREAAAIAVESAMTGHLVLTSVKMESAAWVILHLLNMGVNALSLASTLRAIIAQRLVPRICRDCRQPHPEQAEMIKLLNLPPNAKLFGSVGCPKCYFSGKSGRIAIFETIFVNDALRDLITSGPTISALAVHSKGAGARAFREDALEKCLAGLISPEDVLAV